MTLLIWQLLRRSSSGEALRPYVSAFHDYFVHISSLHSSVYEENTSVKDFIEALEDEAPVQRT